MICAPCRKGGEINRLSNLATKGFAWAELLEASQQEHEKCRGGTQCDCQHFVGDAINKQLVKS